jgi:NAD(P)H-hydrate epimerase
VVVLKGFRTLVAEPGGPLWINLTGNPGMATGGTGDVLTGMVGALVGRLGDPAAAARLAVWLHGTAGDAAAAARGAEPLAAGDLIDHLPDAFRALGAGE